MRHLVCRPCLVLVFAIKVVRFIQTVRFGTCNLSAAVRTEAAHLSDHGDRWRGHCWTLVKKQGAYASLSYSKK